MRKTDSTDGDKAENDEKLWLKTTTTKNIRYETNLKAFEEAGVDDHLAERVNLRNERASSIRFSVFSFHNISAFIFLIAALHRKCVSVNWYRLRQYRNFLQAIVNTRWKADYANKKLNKKLPLRSTLILYGAIYPFRF